MIVVFHVVCAVVQRQLLVWQLLRELTVHTLAEEAILYPVVAEEVCGKVAGQHMGWIYTLHCSRIRVGGWGT